MSSKSSANTGLDAQKVGPALKALTEWEWQALNRGTAYLENKRMSAQVPVRFHPSKLPFIPGGTLRFIFGLHHLRNAYGAAIAGWGGALVVAAWYFTDRSVSDFFPNTTAGFWSLLPGWQSGRVNSRQ